MLNENVQVLVLADTGSQGMFMGRDRAHSLGLKLKPLTSPDQVAFANPDLHESITHYVTCRITVGSYWKDLNFMIANIGDSVILGVPWFDTLRITHLDWEYHQLEFVDKLTGRPHALNLKPAVAQTQVEPRQNKKPKLKRITSKELERIKKSCRSIQIIKIRQLLDIELAALQATDPPQAEIMANAFIREYPSVFSPKVPFPPARPQFDMKIPLDPTKTHPPIRRLRKMNAAELLELKERIQELLERGFIRPSTSDFGAQILFVKKSDGGLRMCVDYRGLNEISLKNRSPLPSIAEMRNRLQGAQHFTKLDLRDGYYNLRMAEEDVHKTAFKCIWPF
jgi:hypothetical protein